MSNSVDSISEGAILVCICYGSGQVEGDMGPDQEFQPEVGETSAGLAAPARRGRRSGRGRGRRGRGRRAASHPPRETLEPTSDHAPTEALHESAPTAEPPLPP